MNIPQSVKNTLWSYNIDKIDLQKNKDTIIFNVLNFGNLESAQWLQNVYSKNEIIDVIEESNTQKWSPKSLNYWATYFSITPKRENRFI